MAKIEKPERDAEWLKIQTQWGNDWQARKNAMLEDFAAIIRRSSVVCVGAVVDAAHFRKLANADPEFNNTFKDSMYLAFHTVVTRGIEQTEVVDKHSSISLVIDDDQEYSMMCYQLLQTLKVTNPKIKDRVDAIAFVNDTTFPGVQAADVIAYVARGLMIEELTTGVEVPASELLKSLTLGLVHQPLHFTPKILDEMQADLHKAAKK